MSGSLYSIGSIDAWPMLAGIVVGLPDGLPMSGPPVGGVAIESVIGQPFGTPCAPPCNQVVNVERSFAATAADDAGGMRRLMSVALRRSGMTSKTFLPLVRTASAWKSASVISGIGAP